MGAALPRRKAEPQIALDYGFLQKLFLFVGIFSIVFCAFTRDPIAFAVGGFLPWLLITIIKRPNMPVAIVFFLIWQWAQTYARELQTFADQEALGSGIFGVSVDRAYWYSLASVLTLALCMRLTLGNLPDPTPQLRTQHMRWQPRDMIILYFAAIPVVTFARIAGNLSGALDQPMSALRNIKVLVLILLFTNVLSTGKGRNFLIFVVVFETISGFTGLFADFKSIFIMLGLAALAVRVPWSFTLSIASVAWLTVIVGLAIFWSGVKMDYRQFATGSDESQSINVSIGDRLGYIGNRAITPSSVDWNAASYALLTRFAYIDIFGSVITVQEANPEPETARQWREALAHVLQPRFLFPDKAPLSDSDVYVRLAKGDPTEAVREGTSISVGYMAENFADFGFPGMLAGIAVIGLIVGSACRYFMMKRNLPWMVREGTVIVLVYSVAQGGLEISLPKLLGAVVMTTLVYMLVVRFAYPYVLRWLNRPPGGRKLAQRRYRAP
jgi:hypothetical protein